MKVLFVSNRNKFFLNTNYYRERALHALGAMTEFFDIRQYILPARARAWFSFLEDMDLTRINHKLIKRALQTKPDVCLVVGGVGVSPATVSSIRKAGIPVLLWTSDPPHPSQFKDIIASAPEYTRVFCAGTEAIDLLKASGYGKAEWLPFACDPECHAPYQGSIDPDLKRDIAFVGSYYANRAHIFDALADQNIGIWGPLWERLPDGARIKSKVSGQRLNFTDWIQIYAAAKEVLVVHYQDGKIPCYQASPKLYEAMACGAFILCDDQKDARTLFNDGEHLVFFRSADELREKALYYLAHTDERRRIADAGRQKVITEHTYHHRMAVLLKAARGEA